MGKWMNETMEYLEWDMKQEWMNEQVKEPGCENSCNGLHAMAAHLSGSVLMQCVPARKNTPP